MPAINSPLRYPGGKAVLTNFLADVIEVNGMQDGIYAEPYAGGAGAALNLLFAEHVDQILINDADPCIYSFWNSILTQPKRFLNLLESTPVTIDEWMRQRDIYQNPKRHSGIKVGFSTFYLNRCNRSGILMNGGPIGGFDQKGNWKIDARFNKENLIDRIKKIFYYRDRINVSNLDAIQFLNKKVVEHKMVDRIFVYLDPPYYVKGSTLYLNHYLHDDHVALAKFIRQDNKFKWIMSYDNTDAINELYASNERVAFNLNYSANKAKVGSELLIYDAEKISLSTDLGL